MNIIISYLETMFSAYRQTPRMLEAKAELQGMMEDAYASLIAEGKSENEAVGQVIRDFGNLAEIAPELGITSELGTAGAGSAAGVAAPGAILADPAEFTPGAPAASTAPPRPRQPQHPPVTLTEAQGYAEAKRRIRFRVAGAVALFVLSPIPLLLLTSASSAGVIALGSGPASLIGLVSILAIVAVGVMILFGTSRELAPFSRLEEGRFSASPEVSGWAAALAQPHDRARTRALQIAIGLWILSPVPLISISLLSGESPERGFTVVTGVAILLAMVACGLFLFIPSSWAHTTAELLTQQPGTPGAGDAEERSVVSVIAAFYWPFTTLIYLGWSFLGDAWGESWVLWPLAGVLFGAIAAGTGAWESYRKNRR